MVEVDLTLVSRAALGSLSNRFPYWQVLHAYIDKVDHSRNKDHDDSAPDEDATDNLRPDINIGERGPSAATGQLLL